MRKIIDGEVYLDTEEAAQVAGLKRGTFYRNSRGRIKPKRPGGMRKPWYKESDIIAFRDGKPTRMASITLRGIYKNWEHALLAEGYEVQSNVRKVEITSLPKELAQIFHLSANEPYVCRSKITFADGIPICYWDSYYPEKFIDSVTFEDMKQDHSSVSTVLRIKEQHGLIVGKAVDHYQARSTTLDEQNLFRLATDDDVIILQRASYTRDKQTLLFVQDMVLLASWFTPEYEYDVAIWD